MAELLAQKLEEKKKEKDERTKFEEERRADGWEECEEWLLCRPCTTYYNHPDLPPAFRKCVRNGQNFGLVSKIDPKTGGQKPRWRINQRCKEHKENTIHHWCEIKDLEVKASQVSFEEENRSVGLVIVMAFLKVARRGGSAADFQDTVDFVHLLNLPKSQKNNLHNIFFTLRSDVFEVVSGIVKKMFAEDVTEFASTLDKVTVQSRSFTVLLSFFFYHGRIHCLLNDLINMDPEDYDSAGTARFISEKLQATLGYTRTKLSEKLLHFSYDGVYATKDQRVAGGGSLDLPGAVSQVLGLEPGHITGTWDFAHNLQIIWNNALLECAAVEAMIALIFASMDEFRVGQSCAVFRKRSAELGNMTLSNKKRQTTRFVRSLIRGMQAWFRNLPSLVAIHGERYNQAVQEKAHADAKVALKMLSKLRDPRLLLTAIGVAQLLEIYVLCSMMSQHSQQFPTQAWGVVNEMKKKVEALSKKWEWSNKRLEFAGTEAPSKIKDMVLDESLYRPLVTLK